MATSPGQPDCVPLFISINNKDATDAAAINNDGVVLSSIPDD